MSTFALVPLGYTTVYQQAFTTLPIAMHADGLQPRAYGLVTALNGIVTVILQPLAGRPRPQHGRRSRQPADRRPGSPPTALASTILGYVGAVWLPRHPPRGSDADPATWPDHNH
jgi:MFS family permease